MPHGRSWGPARTYAAVSHGMNRVTSGSDASTAALKRRGVSVDRAAEANDPVRSGLVNRTPSAESAMQRAGPGRSCLKARGHHLAGIAPAVSLDGAMLGLAETLPGEGSTMR